MPEQQITSPINRTECIQYCINPNNSRHHWLYVPNKPDYQKLREFLHLHNCPKDNLSDDHYLISPQQKADFTAWLNG